MNAPTPAPITLLDHWPRPGLPRPLAEALHAALPAAWASASDADQARLRDVLALLDALGSDGDVRLAALLAELPTLRAALASAAGLPAGVQGLLDGVDAAAQVWALHRDRGDASGGDAEGLRRLLLAIVRDLRVVPILLSAQLARLRRATSLPDAEATALARLTRDIHAPLANRLGIWQLKWELEDLAFRLLEPATYQAIADVLDEKRTDREHYIEQVKRELHAALASNGVQAEVAGRPKHIFSIWRKLQRKGVPIGELYDLRAVRVLVDDVAACYAALGVVHATWVPIPSEFDDYIARPKANDYRSLHTAVIGPEGKTLEVQIRTHAMHAQAELGVAAHWKYKEGGGVDAALEKRVTWMRRLLEAQGGDDALPDAFAAELIEERIYVLTPRGDVLDLPHGATPLDFAYHVHTEVGHRCIGAKVDGRIVPLDYRLRSGERIEILTGKQAVPRRDWLLAANGFLASGRARDKVRAWFHQLDRARNVQAGREMLERELKRVGAQGIDVAPVLERFRIRDADELAVHVALGDLGPHQIARALLEHERARTTPAVPAPAPVVRKRSTARGTAVTVEGLDNLLVQLARCCQPLPGEPIVGYLTRGRGVSVHRPDCPAFLRLQAEQPQRVLPVAWGVHAERHEVDTLLDALDRKDLLRDVTHLLAQQDVPVAAIASERGRDRSRVRLRLRLRVTDYGQLADVLSRLASLPGVDEVRRAG